MSALMMGGDKAVTMSSLEIAELTGKRHDHVMRDIRTMLTELHGSDRLPKAGETVGENRLLSFEQTVERPNPSGGAPIKSTVFKLPKRETLVLVSGYSIALRAKIIDRWQELEQRAVKPAEPTRLELIRLALASETERLALAAKVEQDAPKVQFHDDVAEATNGQSVSEIAKILGTGEIRLFRWLRERGFLMSNNLPRQHHIDAGLFRVVERRRVDKDGNAITYSVTTITGKGLIRIQRLRAGEAAALSRQPSLDLASGGAK